MRIGRGWFWTAGVAGLAVGLRRAFPEFRFAGKVVAITFASRHTKDEAAEVNDTLAEKAAAGNLQVVCVVA